MILSDWLWFLMMDLETQVISSKNRLLEAFLMEKFIVILSRNPALDYAAFGRAFSLVSVLRHS